MCIYEIRSSPLVSYWEISTDLGISCNKFQAVYTFPLKASHYIIPFLTACLLFTKICLVVAQGQKYGALSEIQTP